jgi:D-psicose/D-tagatose/L-ribulose 3-epimerase
MKFGVNTFIWSATFDPSHFALLPRIKEAGFDGVEVPLFRPAEFAASNIRKAAEAYGLECNVCTVLVDDLSLISENADIRRQTRLHLEDIVKAAAEAGAGIVAGPLYSPVGYLPGRRRTTDEWKWAVEGFQSLGDTLAIHGVTFAIEPLNRFETYFLNTAADAAALAEQIDQISAFFLTPSTPISKKRISLPVTPRSAPTSNTFTLAKTIVAYPDLGMWNGRKSFEHCAS